MASRDQAFDQRLHLDDVLGRARLQGRAQAAERIHVLVVLLLCLLGHEADRLVQRQLRKLFRRPCVDLVVNVGDVAHISDVLGTIEMT